VIIFFFDAYFDLKNVSQFPYGLALDYQTIRYRLRHPCCAKVSSDNAVGETRLLTGNEWGQR